MIRIPNNLIGYVDFEEGKILAVNLPKDLEDDFEKLKQLYESMKKDKLADY